MSNSLKMSEVISASLRDSRLALDRFMQNPAHIQAMEKMAGLLSECFNSGHKVLACGNGGSACDALHFAEEFTGRYRGDRRPLPVIPLLEGANLTCVANDYGFAEIFARGVMAYGQKGDILLAISTSGNSENILRAVQRAKENSVQVLLLLGREGGALKGQGDCELIVAADTTDRIQEVHMVILHILIECVERRLFPENYP